MLQPSPTHQHQSNMAMFCRSGEYIAIPGVKEKNIGRYRKLIYTIVDDSLQSTYPLTFELLEEQEWNNLVDEFFRSHKCQSPMVWKMPKELLDYMQACDHSLLHKYVFLSDLLLLEWHEVEVYMMEDLEPSPFKKEGLMTRDKLLINPELSILSLSYPVHLKNASKISAEDEGQYFVCLHREAESGKVQFTDIKYPHVELIQMLLNEASNFNKLLSVFLKYASEEDAIIALSQFLSAGIESELILGFSSEI